MVGGFKPPYSVENPFIESTGVYRVPTKSVGNPTKSVGNPTKSVGNLKGNT